MSALAQGSEGLEQKGRFSYSGITADQDRRPWNEPAAQDPVEFFDSGKNPGLAGRRDFRDRRCDFGRSQGQLAAGMKSTLDPFFHQGIPLIAVRAFPEPLRRLKAATLAGVDNLGFGHARTISALQLFF